MDLNELLIFTRVVQSGSFTAAARLLEMPKSTVSRKVAELEDRVGARLLQRTTRKLGLTDAGRIYFDYGARIVTEVEEAEQAVGRLQSTPRGLLRVTAPLSLSILGPIVADFLQRQPDVQVDLRCSDRVVDLVEEGFDLAIRAGRLSDSTLVARPLGVLRRVVVASPSYVKRHRAPAEPADLERHDGLAFGGVTAPNVWTLTRGEEKVEVRVVARLTVNDLDILGEVTRAARGVAFMPEFAVAEDLRQGRLQRLLPEWCSEEVPLSAVYPTTRHLSPKVTAFIEHVVARMKAPRRK